MNLLIINGPLIYFVASGGIFLNLEARSVTNKNV